MIIASMATIKGREKQCKIAADSLRPQCDLLLIHDKPMNGRRDDSRKFGIGNREGYILTVDDDLKFPPSYCAWMVQVLAERTAEYGPCVISLMGRTLRPPLASYYRDRQNYTKYDWRDPTAREGPVHILGTGCLCYHTDTVRFDMDDFPIENAADINVGIKLNELGIPAIRVAPPKKGWLEYLPVPDTIFDRYCDNDEAQTTAVNNTQWVEL